MQNPNFLEGEVVLYESKPLPQVKTYTVVSTMLGFGAFLSIWGVPLLIGMTMELGIEGFFLLFFGWMGIMAVILLISIFFADASYKQRYYWITNRRVIYRRGVFGYTMSSLPYERISDVIISRTFWENLFGFGSLQIQTLAGQISTARGGAEGYLQAIPEPEKVQEIILTAMKDKMKL